MNNCSHPSSLSRPWPTVVLIFVLSASGHAGHDNDEWSRACLRPKGRRKPFPPAGPAEVSGNIGGGLNLDVFW